MPSTRRVTFQVHACPVPPDSAIVSLLPGADFHDAYQVEVTHTDRTALQHLLAAMAATPPWVDGAMRVRNRVAAWVGLKNLGDLSLASASLRTLPQSPQPGDRVGIFTLRSLSDDEVLVEDNDKHLHVVLSVRRCPAEATQPARIVLTTVVHLHNLLGRLYMLPVTPMHRLIAPAVLGRVNQDTAGM